MTLWTAAGSTGANLLGYVFNLIMTHALGVNGYGELAVLLALIVVASVPGTALQAAIARRVTSGQAPQDLVRTSVLASLAVCALILVLSPALRPALHIHGLTPLLWTAANLVPVTLAFALQGVLQGARRFSALGAMLVAVQLARVAAGVVAAVWRPTSSTALATGTLLTAALVIVVARPVLRGLALTSDRPLVPELLRDIAPILGVLVLSSLDLLLARHFLTGRDSGLYAAGNLVTRACFWGPAFIALSNYPRFVDPVLRRPAIRHSVATLAVLAAIAMVVSLAGQALVPLLLGHGYRGVAGKVWLFAADGLALAGVQLAVFVGIAIHDRRLGRLVWLVAVAEVLVVWLGAHHNPTQIITVALCGGLTLLTGAFVLERRRVDGPTSEAGV